MKIKNLKIKSGMLAIILASSLGLTGCGKKSDCEIEKYHLHRYVKNGMARYIEDEHLKKNGYNWTDNVVYVDEENKKIYDFEKKKKLLKIEDNEDYLERIQEQNHDFMEYRYSYIYFQPIFHTHNSGKVTYTTVTYIPVKHHSWTSDPNHINLTGETRVCHHVYSAYQIAKNEKGKYVLISSPEVDDIFTVKDDYPYIKERFVKIVEKGTQTEVSYEDLDHDDTTNIASDEEAANYEIGKEYQKTR